MGQMTVDGWTQGTTDRPTSDHATTRGTADSVVAHLGLSWGRPVSCGRVPGSTPYTFAHVVSTPHCGAAVGLCSVCHA